MCADRNVESCWIDGFRSGGYRASEGCRAETIMEMTAVSVNVTTIRTMKQ